jgi:hypothetical protein
MMPLDTIPKDKLYTLIQRKLEKYQAEEREAKHGHKETKDRHKRLTFREDELIAHGKTLAATEILEDVAGFGRQTWTKRDRASLYLENFVLVKMMIVTILTNTAFLIFSHLCKRFSPLVMLWGSNNTPGHLPLQYAFGLLFARSLNTRPVYSRLRCWSLSFFHIATHRRSQEIYQKSQTHMHSQQRLKK